MPFHVAWKVGGPADYLATNITWLNVILYHVGCIQKFVHSVIRETRNKCWGLSNSGFGYYTITVAYAELKLCRVPVDRVCMENNVA